MLPADHNLKSLSVTPRRVARRVINQLGGVWAYWNLGDDIDFKGDFLRMVVNLERDGAYGLGNYEWQTQSYDDLSHRAANNPEIQKLQYGLLEQACIFAVKTMRAPRSSSAAWGHACQAEHWLGVLMGLISGFSIQFQLAQNSSQESRTQAAKDRAEQRWLNDPSQKAKLIAKECWDAWKKEPGRYKNQPSFAIDVLDKVDLNKDGNTVITFNTIMKRYIPEWQRQE